MAGDLHKEAKCSFQCQGADSVRVYRQHGVDLQEDQSKLCRAVQDTEDCSTTVIFALRQEIQKCESLRKSDYFSEQFWPVVNEDVNGAFQSKYSVDEEGEVVAHTSWSCFKIKKVIKPSALSKVDYSWDQVSVFVQFQPKTGHQVVIFIDLPTQLQSKMGKPLISARKDNPFIWHTILLQQVKVLYNGGVWSMRGLVRDMEKARDANPPPVPNFPHLHDIARHVSHTNEILEVAEHTVSRIIQEQIAWKTECCHRSPRKRPFLVQNEQDLLFFAKEIHSFKIRSRSLSERMQNEINLAFNLVSQKQGRNAQGDNAMMKTIAIVSLVYLPGTFISGLFGTNFFNLSTENGSEEAWVVSSQFWLYWAITIPLTIATVIVWAIWHFSNRSHNPKRLDIA